ncbi:MAG: hypothetical protein MUF73_09830 [Rhodobacteraceae bacterium]|nr:hypothetical protein [Paracoccaceae bacterium]
MIAPLHRKVLRDLVRLWPQSLAIALVLAGGVATLITCSGAHSALSETRARHSDDDRVADVLADVTRAPPVLLDDIRDIDGVVKVEDRIVKRGLLEMPDLVQPDTIFLAPLPVEDGSELNCLHLQQGRLPDPQSAARVLVSKGFAAAHGLRPGSVPRVVMPGQRRDLRITGIALSPEFTTRSGLARWCPARGATASNGGRAMRLRRPSTSTAHSRMWRSISRRERPRTA